MTFKKRHIFYFFPFFPIEIVLVQDPGLLFPDLMQQIASLSDSSFSRKEVRQFASVTDSEDLSEENGAAERLEIHIK